MAESHLVDRPDADYDGTKTVRVRGIPLAWDADRLQSFFRECDDSDDSAPIRVESLAPEVHGRSLTATIVFRHNHQFLQIPSPEKPTELPLSGRRHDGPPVRLALDVDFLGLTTLFVPREEEHKVDVVAISGLGGHAFGSFKQRGGDHMWLRDALPPDLTSENRGQPMARLMTYGYQSEVAGSRSVQNIKDLASSLQTSLLPLVTGLKRRPIIFIAHSLGGLVVKQTLISLAESQAENYKTLLKLVYAVAFFGVPHDGMDTSSLMSMVGDGPNRFLVESISRLNSTGTQERQFRRYFGRERFMEVFCFYETKLSPTAQQDVGGKWTMSGPQAMLVSRSSATNCGAWDDGLDQTCPIARTHSDMVKFARHDDEYDKVLTVLADLARRAVAGRRRPEAPGTGSTKPIKFVVPYEQNQDFVGRGDTLNNVKKLLGFGQPPGASQRRSRVALYGLGGIGKTQIALAYVYWLRGTCPDVSVFWIHASNAERFRQSYSSIAAECQIPGLDDPKADVLLLVKTWLDKEENGPWVMVIDNADDAELFFGRPNASAPPATPEVGVARYLPESSHGTILITTRNKQAGSRLIRGRAPLEVVEMDDDESIRLLQTRIEEHDKDKLRELASELEHLPLALVQAAAFIQENCINVAQYLELLHDSDQGTVDLLSEEFETEGRDSETPRAVALTWMLSFQQIERQNSFAGKLMSFMSMLDRQAIPNEFLEDYGKDQSALELTKARGLLIAFSFVTQTSDGLDMHRLVQLVTRTWINMQGTSKEFERAALLTVSRLVPFGEYETRAKCSAYLAHAYAVMVLSGNWSEQEFLAVATLQIYIAAYFHFEGRWRVAATLTEGAVATQKRILGKEHPATLTSMNNLASILRHQGQLQEAKELGAQVMEIRKRILGEEHPDTLASMNNLALTLQGQGQLQEAEELGAQVMEIRKRILGEEHPDTLTSIDNLASILRDQGQLQEAKELGTQVMEIRKRILGEEHPDTLTSIDNLASILRDQGQLQEAKELGHR